MRLTTYATPFPTRTADPRCLTCYKTVFQAADGLWRHAETGSRTCRWTDHGLRAS